MPAACAVPAARHGVLVPPPIYFESWKLQQAYSFLFGLGIVGLIYFTVFR